MCFHCCLHYFTIFLTFKAQLTQQEVTSLSTIPLWGKVIVKISQSKSPILELKWCSLRFNPNNKVTYTYNIPVGATHFPFDRFSFLVESVQAHSPESSFWHFSSPTSVEQACSSHGSAYHWKHYYININISTSDYLRITVQ